VLYLMAGLGHWRWAFVLTGCLGFAWLFAWRLCYHPPEVHPRIAAEERAMILADRAAEHSKEAGGDGESLPSWERLLSLPQPGGTIASRALTDPVWFMIADWFAISLVSRGFKLEETAAGIWIPFLAADLGNFAGGWASGALIRRGWSVGRARRAVILAGGVGGVALVPAAFLSSFFALMLCFAIAPFSYAALARTASALPADLYQSRAVASVAGLAGTGAGLSTIGSTFLIGIVADRFSFTPILVVASVVPLLAAAIVLALV